MPPAVRCTRRAPRLAAATWFWAAAQTLSPFALAEPPISLADFRRLSIEEPRAAIDRGEALAASPWATEHPDFHRELLVRSGWAAQALGDAALVERQARRLDAFAAATGDALARAHAAFVRAALAAETGDAARALESAAAAAATLAAESEPLAQATAAAGLCDIAARAARWDLAERHCPAALDAWSALDDAFQIGRMENYLSMAARNAGRADEAIQLAQRARERFRDLAIPALERAMDDNLSALLLDRGAPGDAARALELSRASLAHELAAGKRQFAVVSRLNVARALSALARHDEALAEIAAAIAEAERIPYETALPELHATQLEIADAAGRWPLVAAAARAALAAAARNQDREREQLVAEMEARYRAFEQRREIDRLAQQGRLRELELAAAQGDLRRQRLLLGSAAVAGASLAGASALLVALLRAGRRREQELDRITRTDALTGAASRRAFLAALERAFDAWRTTGTPATLVLLDADHFKALNDRYGHPAGDRALVSLVDRMRGEIRDSDLVGRLGGEEFALLLSGLGRDEALRRAEAVRAAIAAAPHQLDGPAVRLTASVGVAALDDGYPDAERWLTAADDALYEAKRAGRDRVAAAVPAPPVAAT